MSPWTRLVIGVAAEEAQEVLVAAEIVIGQAQIDGVVEAAMRVHRIVAAVLNQVAGDHADPRGLRQRAESAAGSIFKVLLSTATSRQV